uniref:Cl315_1 n=1 Tax=Arundo donax TaxID=35708 RepID=A0A0A9FXA1_ARUDO
MTAASGCRKGSIRYWVSSGPGDFLLSSKGCPSPAFYAVVIPADYDQCREGVRAVTTSVPMKPPLFATMKNVNYLPNVLSIMDAEDRGAFAYVWVDDQGYVAERPMVNVAFVTPDRELVRCRRSTRSSAGAPPSGCLRRRPSSWRPACSRASPPSTSRWRRPSAASRWRSSAAACPYCPSSSGTPSPSATGRWGS